MTRLTEWWVARQMANERSRVKDPRRARRVMITDAVLAVLAFAALITAGLQGPWVGLARMTLGVFVGASLFAATRRALSYRSGWLDGRVAMMVSMQEAQLRGMSAEEWLEGEMQRDFVMMGWADLDDGEGR
jgi:hypothetical protein